MTLKTWWDRWQPRRFCEWIKLVTLRAQDIQEKEGERERESWRLMLSFAQPVRQMAKSTDPIWIEGRYSLFLPRADEGIIEATLLFPLILIDVIKSISVSVGIELNLRVLATWKKAGRCRFENLNTMMALMCVTSYRMYIEYNFLDNYYYHRLLTVIVALISISSE